MGGGSILSNFLRFSKKAFSTQVNLQEHCTGCHLHAFSRNSGGVISLMPIIAYIPSGPFLQSLTHLDRNGMGFTQFYSKEILRGAFILKFHTQCMPVDLSFSLTKMWKKQIVFLVMHLGQNSAIFQ